MNLHDLAAQLYTVRTLCQTPRQTAATLQKIQSIGYRAVEVAGICPIDSSELLHMTGDAGLTICAMHDDPNTILNEPQKVIERLDALGCEFGVYSYPVGFDLGKAVDVQTLVDKLISAGTAFRAAGKTLCYHHHSLEFARYGKHTVLEHVVQTINPASLSIELDTYWVQHGGGVPADWCTRLKNRLPVLHLKDYGSIGGTPTMMEVGRGNFDWVKIIAAAKKSGCRWFVVEQDTCPGNPLDSLKISYDYLHSNFISPAT